jgi:hypothetical protein
LLIAVGGPSSAELAGRAGDGFIATSPEGDLIEIFDKAGGHGKPRYGSLTVWGQGREVRTADCASNLAYPGMESSLSWELALPTHFEDVAKLVRRRRREGDRLRAGSGASRGGDHEICEGRLRPHRRPPGWSGSGGFFRYYATDVLPRLKPVTTAA